jgi:hypothetical protein
MVNQVSHRSNMQPTEGTFPSARYQQFLTFKPILSSPGATNFKITSPLSHSRVTLDAYFSRTVSLMTQTMRKHTAERRNTQERPTYRHLSRTFLQQDEHCEQNSDLHQLFDSSNYKIICSATSSFNYPLRCIISIYES